MDSIRSILSVCTTAVFMSGCGDHVSTDKPVEPSQKQAGSASVTDLDDSFVRDLDDAIGLTPIEVIRTYGSPNHDFKLTIGEDGFGEEFVEIFNTYHPDAPESQGVVIRIMRWTSLGDKRTIQLHKIDGEWRVLVAFEYPDGVEF